MEKENKNEKIGCDLDDNNVYGYRHKHICQKDIAEKFYVNILRNIPCLSVKPFIIEARNIINNIIDEVVFHEYGFPGELQDMMNQLYIIPEYYVEKRNSDRYNFYYLKIEYFNCPPENIKISSEFLAYLRRYYPRTRFLIITPYDKVFYSIDLDEITDEENLDLNDYPIENKYECLVQNKELIPFIDNLRDLYKKVIEVK